MHHTLYFSNMHIEQNSLNLNVLTSSLGAIDDNVWRFWQTFSFNQLYFVLDGDGAYIENEHGSYTLRPGYMYLVPAYCNNHFVCTNFLHYYVAQFNLEILPGVDLLGYQLNTVQELPFSQEQLDLFFEAEKNTALTNVIHLKTLFWQVINEFTSHYASDIDYKKLFDGLSRQYHVLQYISAHLNASLRIQDIADNLNIPVWQLSRNFRQDVGQSLKVHIEHMLFSKAVHLLLHTTKPICQISDQLGFSDPFYFSRFFKKYTYISPKEYRKQQS